MFLLNALMGGLLNVIGVLRAAVYSRGEKLKRKKLWNGSFMVLYALSYLAVFLVFDKPFTLQNALVEILPLIAMGAMTIAFSKTSAAVIRRYGLVNSPCWLIYNVVNLSVGGILCEVFSLVSVISAIIRLDLKKEKRNENAKS